MALEDVPVPVKIKLSALWASLMFCYIYGDYFGLYVPGALQHMLDGKMGPLGPTTQGILVGTTAMMVIPSLMVFLSVALKASINRWLNIVLGGVYAVIIVMTMSGAWDFYVTLGAVEIGLSLLTVWIAWNWPRQQRSTP